MYHSERFRQLDEETFVYQLPDDRDFKILQLTDLHLGYGILSGKEDAMACRAIKTIIQKTKPDLIVLTGDLIFPFLLRAGTMNNGKEAKELTKFMDAFQIPYVIVLGNHDAEKGAFYRKDKLMTLFAKGKYSICARGKKEISGIGNYMIQLKDTSNKTALALVMLDSNMYSNSWFFSGFDWIHEDQTDWCMRRLEKLKESNPKLKALAFFHIPPAEMKEAYEKMKLGDHSIRYQHGSIAESGEYFGISNNKSTFFSKAVKAGIIKGMFFGHDHLNTLSLIYHGIQLTYGMSIDYLGYPKIGKKYTQRGGTLITRRLDGTIAVKPVPLDRVVSNRIHGIRDSRNDR